MGREVANRHGRQRTGWRIIDQVKRALGAAEVHDEFGTPFVWLSGTYRDRIRYRGLENCTIRDVSRTEVAAILDEIGADLQASEDPAGDLARPGLAQTGAGRRLGCVGPDSRGLCLQPMSGCRVEEVDVTRIDGKPPCCTLFANRVHACEAGGDKVP